MTNFHEEQRFRQVWLWIIIPGGSTLMIVLAVLGILEQVINDRQWGTNPISDTWLVVSSGLMVIGALLLVYGFIKLRLIISVTDQRIFIRLWPFPGKTIVPAEIRNAQAITFSPLKDHGGWGIRFFEGGRAYTVSGNHGVEMELISGKKLIVGSRLADELALAIKALCK